MEIEDEKKESNFNLGSLVLFFLLSSLLERILPLRWINEEYMVRTSTLTYCNA